MARYRSCPCRSNSHWDEDVDGAPQRYRQSLSVPGIVRHVELLKQNLSDPRESLQDTSKGRITRDGRMVVKKAPGAPRRGDGRTNPPPEMPRRFEKMGR